MISLFRRKLEPFPITDYVQPMLWHHTLYVMHSSLIHTCETYNFQTINFIELWLNRKHGNIETQKSMFANHYECKFTRYTINRSDFQIGLLIVYQPTNGLEKRCGFMNFLKKCSFRSSTRLGEKHVVAFSNQLEHTFRNVKCFQSFNLENNIANGLLKL